MGIQLEDNAPEFGQRTPRSRSVVAAKAFALFAVLAVIFFPFLELSSTHAMKIRLYTNNIRFDNRNIGQGEHYWEEREPYVSESIRIHTQPGPSVVCLQEVLHNQLHDILGNLNKAEKDTWAYYGVGRTDGKTAGEYLPILFRNADWELVSLKTFWLSPTPEKPSRGWDAVLERIVTVVVLKSKATGKKVKVLNTHYDHIGVVARRELSKLIMSKMDAGPEPAFLCGDFNTEPKDEPYQLLQSSGFKDSRVQGEDYGYKTTFSGFNREHEDNTIIDYIWAGNGTEWQTYGVLPNYFEFYMSDHRPVMADYLI